ncbi:hypothetical protein BCR33DRAFT_717360 [Rhizoclosmatium globosum]|uniref:Aspartate/glutamate/uridylate kinase domain-containing protein n=1 Tax=Rhizoclosmatium globosum TaxID=329046 RepID=A0A1Y2C9J0_9FUNG|nr:hypothetical protein BCR33DRAFT_717360 [Rhizoclosmatium globosum]|eukprot:ORY43698.1 hypothetical protein BCR33DRAFT_717360 [Rhizoclosmatium globosum]
MDRPCYVIKLGGAAITNKAENEFATIDNTILVCGVGPFGHTNVVKYGIKDGVFTQEHKDGLKVTKNACDHVGRTVCSVGRSLGLKMEFVPAYQVARQNNKKDSWIDVDCFEEILSTGAIPVTTGSMVPDLTLGHSVMSGDEFIALFTRHFQPECVFLGTNVDGIFTSDPNILPNSAKLIPLVNKENISRVLEGASGSASAVDVTGGMQGKLEKLANSIGTSTGFVFRLGVEGLLLQGLRDGTMDKCTVQYWSHAAPCVSFP